MAIVVTGSAGFIGSNFVLDWLQQSDERVINLDALTYAGNLENLVSLMGDARHLFVKGGIGGNESKTQFAVVLFVGLIVLNLFSEVINRAPSLILANVNYVKKVVFPIEILPVIALGAALFHSLVSLGVLLAAFALFNGYLHWTAVFIPVVMLPLVILSTGISWMLASIGVFLRDVGQTIGIPTTVLMFLSPVFYPVTAVPERFRSVLMANPLTFIIEQAREVLIWGHLPNWLGLDAYTLVATVIAWAGYAWFQKTRKGFADVL